MEEGQKYTQLFSPFSQSLAESEIPWAELPTKSVLGLIPKSCAEGPRYNLYSAITRTLDPQVFVQFSDAFEQFLQDNPLANDSALQVETFPVQGVEALPDDYSAFPHRNHFRNQVEGIGVYTDDSVADAVNEAEAAAHRRRAAVPGPGHAGLRRLTNLKNAYDPHGFFDGYHAVPSDLAQWS